MLVNGRRFVSSSTASLNSSGLNNPVGGPGQQVDFNTIPTKLIDRVETISVGGAPIYGADAIAGTVNIILKKDFEGLDVDAQTGVSDHKDAWNYRFRALAGQNFADGRGNITGVAEITKTDGLVGTARPVYRGLAVLFSGGPRAKYQTVLTPGVGGAQSTSAAYPWWTMWSVSPTASASEFRIRRWESPTLTASSSPGWQQFAAGPVQYRYSDGKSGISTAAAMVCGSRRSAPCWRRPSA